MQHRLEPRDLLFYLVTQMSWPWHFTLTQIWKQRASASYGCVLVWVILQKSYVVYSQQYTFLQAVTLWTSKVGTKLSALKPPAAHLLSVFGKSLSSPNQDEIMRKAVQNLVQLLKPNGTCTTMDILRFEMYHQRKVSVWSPFPTTYQCWSTFAHFEMPVYTTHTQIHCLQNVTVDPTKSRMTPYFLSTIKTMSGRALYKQAVIKSA